MRPGQPRSTSLRIDAPSSAPIDSNPWCTSSTCVASGPTAVKHTSTSDFIAGSGCQRAFTCQTITTRCGGSQRMIVATVVCDPSCDNLEPAPAQTRLHQNLLDRFLADAVVMRPPTRQAAGE